MEEMQNKAVVFFVFYLWSTIEIFRWVEMLGWCLNPSPLDQLSSWERCWLTQSLIWFGIKDPPLESVAAAMCSANVRQSCFKLPLDRSASLGTGEQEGPREMKRPIFPFKILSWWEEKNSWKGWKDLGLKEQSRLNGTSEET